MNSTAVKFCNKYSNTPFPRMQEETFPRALLTISVALTFAFHALCTKASDNYCYCNFAVAEAGTWNKVRELSSDASHLHAAFSHPCAPHPPRDPQQPRGISDHHLPSGNWHCCQAVTVTFWGWFFSILPPKDVKSSILAAFKDFLAFSYAELKWVAC